MVGLGLIWLQQQWELSGGARIGGGRVGSHTAVPSLAVAGPRLPSKVQSGHNQAVGCILGPSLAKAVLELCGGSKPACWLQDYTPVQPSMQP